MVQTVINGVATDDKESVRISITPEGHEPNWIDLPPDGIESFLQQVASQRSQLKDPVRPDLDPGSRIDALVDPRLHVERYPQGAMLAIRHPGFGWLGFALPEQSVQDLARLLTLPPDSQS